MGAEVCRAVIAEDDLDLVAAVDPSAHGRDLDSLIGVPAGGIVVSEAIGSLGEAGVEVAVDFTVAAAAVAGLSWCAANGTHAVSGTTGIGKDEIDLLRRSFGSGTNCLIAPNFSLGAALMMRCAELCAPIFGAVEVVELHHDAKRDAPSGTSLETARRLGAARELSGSGPWTAASSSANAPGGAELAGARGALSSEGIRVHSVRLPGLVAHQEVIFGGLGETLTIRHDSYDRTSFMPGVLLAIRRVASLDGLVVGLDALI